jgi:hypothetical protein
MFCLDATYTGGDTMADLPKDRIVVRKGQVVRYESWMDWNSMPVMVFQFVRKGNGHIQVSINDPEHTGCTVSGPPETVFAKVFHPDMAAGHRELFEMTGVDPSSLRKHKLYRSFDIQAF